MDAVIWTQWDGIASATGCDFAAKKSRQLTLPLGFSPPPGEKWAAYDTMTAKKIDDVPAGWIRSRWLDTPPSDEACRFIG